MTSTATPPAPAAPAAGGDKLAAKFRKVADTLEKEIRHRKADRLTNTPKRAHEASLMRIEAALLERVQTVLRRLADRRDAGTCPPELAGVKTKDDVRKLVSTLHEHAGHYSTYDTGKFHNTGPAGLAAQALLAEGDDPAVRAERDRAAVIRRLEDEVRFSKIPGFFPTPPKVIEKMLELAGVGADHAVLDPSAGTGSLLDAVAASVRAVAAVEYQHRLADVLEAKGHPTTRADFLELPVPEAPRYDRVLMNPPFERGQDADHVQRAFLWLAPGGRLVSVMSTGAFHRSGNKETAFRGWLGRVGGVRHDLPAGSFTGADVFRETGTSSCLVVVDR